MCAMWKRSLYIASCTYRIREHALRVLLTNQQAVHLNKLAPVAPTSTSTTAATVTPDVNIQPSARYNSNNNDITHTHHNRIDDVDVDADADSILFDQTVSVIEPLHNLPDVSHVGPPLDYKSFNFAAYANESTVIQQLIHMGVDFHAIETREKLPTYLLSLNFETDVKPFIRYDYELGESALHMANLSNNVHCTLTRISNLNTRPHLTFQILTR